MQDYAKLLPTEAKAAGTKLKEGPTSYIIVPHTLGTAPTQ